MNHKEKRGIYNVSFNEKKATPINSELEAIENAIIEYVIHYVKGWHNIKRDKGRGAEHIKLHLQQGSEGEITIEELLNLGKSIREYLKIFKEPFLEDENKSGKVYEWQDKNGIRFRVATDINREEGLIPPLSPSDEIIISFYSDRNLNQKMQFKNPEVEAYYSTYTPKTKEELKDLVNDLSINLGYIDTSKITDMSKLFFQTSRTDFSGIEKWDVSNVENMYAMFEEAASFNADISKWNVSNVEDMGSMFNGAISFNADISGWDVSNVRDMGCMFAYATSFNQPIGEWKVSNVRDMAAMFNEATSFNQPIENWDVSRVKDMDSMFYCATSFNQDISNWNVSNVENMRCMFIGAKAFNQDISGWNVSNVTEMRYMFYEAKSFNQDLSSWDISSVENIDDETKDLICNNHNNVRRM
ncbi:BspA family leucine-rich repeat surface protein [Helicobacter pullorum]|uniref:Membrane-associated lipoprotein n=1 Tax=Helicobacter pullorum TaxID=35818 RepID=A0A377Q287_9HELI|nr:BspA family leucine-rich repeat surface protein [Helicobacter pullorum]STQ88912.1 membrane-associated lipoprotein [Helicobacter pullorum]